MLLRIAAKRLIPREPTDAALERPFLSALVVDLLVLRRSLSASLAMCLALPWEVIERVIDHSADSTETLYSFALTCRDLRPHSTILLLRCIKPKTRDQLFAICAMLKTNPHLQPCVRSASIPVHEFSPHPLLRILPNLSEIEFTDYPDSERDVVFHPSVLKCCHQLGQHIQTLSLQNLRFSSTSAFSDLLLSLPNIRSLSCAKLDVRLDRHHLHTQLSQLMPVWENGVTLDNIPQELMTRRLLVSGRLRLRTLAVSVFLHLLIVNIQCFASSLSIIRLGDISALLSLPCSAGW